MPDSVLITGGCGFIASHLIEGLADDGYDIRLLDNMFRGTRRNIPDAAREEVEVLRGDIRNRDVVRAAIEDVEYVVHLAAICLNRSVEYPNESLTVNLIGTNNVFELSAKVGVEKVLFASSASVYGDQSLPMHEDDKPQPQTPYGVSKLAGEHLLDYYSSQHALDSLAYRFFNVYGPRQHTDAYYTSVINVFIERLLNEQPPTIHGSGEQTMDFIHARDIARGLRLGLETDVSNTVVNLGSGEMTSIRELAETLVNIVGADTTPEFEERDVIVSERRASTLRAKDRLGFETEVPIREGLEEVVEWIRTEGTTIEDASI